MPIEGSYQVRARFTRVDGGGAMIFYIPVGTNAVSVIMGDQANDPTKNRYLLSDIGQGQDDSTYQGVLENNRQYTAQITVLLRDREADIIVDLDNIPLHHWSGLQQSLNPWQNSGFHDKNNQRLQRIGLFAFRLQARVHSVHFRKIDPAAVSNMTGASGGSADRDE